MLKTTCRALFMAFFLFLGWVIIIPGDPAPADQNLPDPRNVFNWSRQERFLGFKSVEKIAPTHTVEAGGRVRELKAASSAVAVKMAAELKPATDKLIGAGDIVGVLVVHKGEVLAERYAQGFKPEERWTSFSVAKSITGTLAGAAVRDGFVSLDDPVVKYVPELKGSAYEGVAVRHLLTMTSGVEWNETYTDPDSDTARLAMGFGSEDPLADLAALPRVSKLGTDFSYKTGESNLLGLVVSRAVKKTLAEYFSEKIWRPCGMESPAAWAVDSQGREMAGCCLSMTLRDYARFGLFILDELRSDQSAVLPAGWFKEATKPVLGHNYGYQWHLIDKNIFAATGIFGQMITIDGTTDSVAVILSAWDTPTSAAGDDNRFGYLLQLRGIILKNGGGLKK